MNNTNLHVYLHTWNLSGFKKYLDTGEISGLEVNTRVGGGGEAHVDSPARPNRGPKSSSGPKSWTLSSLAHLPKKPDPNVRDGFGRTVLHLVCSSLDPRSYDFLAILLSHPLIQVNHLDAESGWTALHRAMWVGNLRAARELLSRAETDLGVKDNEGLTAMDLWNSTCEGTNPEEDAEGTDLFTWGSNKNYTLGLPDPADRALPERVKLLTRAQLTGRPLKAVTQRGHFNATGEELSVSKAASGVYTGKFDHVGVMAVAMSKWHTAVVTTDGRDNLSLAGVGSTGRLGKTIHSQYALQPHTGIPYTITAVALGQDHTLALTSDGFVFSWGQNRFSQLGYVIEQQASGQDSVHKAFSGLSSSDDAFQVIPRRIIGPFKKEIVIGVAASRLSSACWTKDAVWTWGTNSGHLGYEKASNPVQILPRKATAIAQPVLEVALTDYALACLLETHEVLVLHGDIAIKVNFPTQRFPSEFMVYRPPAFIARPNIAKITSSGITFAALSSLGDVFTFILPNPVDIDPSRDTKGKPFVVKPQMIWALRKRFTAVKDVALGSDGAVIICTHSGHVYVRQRAGKQWSFKRTPFLQRVIRVAANETGSFAAIRSDARPSMLAVVGRTLPEDLLDLLPHMRRFSHLREWAVSQQAPLAGDEEDDEEVDTAILRDMVIVRALGRSVAEWSESDEALTLGCDAYVLTQERHIPVHSFMLLQRLVPLRALWSRGGEVRKPDITMTRWRNVPALDLSGYSLWSVLLLLQYVYSDDITAIWDFRVLGSLRVYIPKLTVDIAKVRRDLGSMAQAFALSAWQITLNVTGKIAMPSTLPSHLRMLHQEAQRESSLARNTSDVVLRLADRDVYGYSLILRGRCPFFEAMFGDDAWVDGRRNEDGNGRIVIRLPNLRWRSARIALMYVYDGVEDDIFDYNHQTSLDDFLDFVFEVMAAANELLLDRMVILCSVVVRRHLSITNASALACEASVYYAHALKASIFTYIAASLETMLENGMLDQMDLKVLNELAMFVQDKQGARLPISRSNVLLELAVDKHLDWLTLEDIPGPRLRIPRVWRPRSPKLKPVAIKDSPAKQGRELRAVLERENGKEEDIFDMDEEDLSQGTSGANLAVLLSADHAGNSPSPWRSRTISAQKTDLRTIMAETSQQAINSPLKKNDNRSDGPSQSPRLYGTAVRPSAGDTPDLSAKGFSPAEQTSRINNLQPSSQSLSSFSGPPIEGSQVAGFPALSRAQADPSDKIRLRFPPIGHNSGSRNSASIQKAKLNATAGPSSGRSPLPPSSRGRPAPRKTSEPAWIVPTLAAPVQSPPFASSPSTTVSLTSIQESQTRQAKAAIRDVGPRSLLDIQEQERRDEEAQATEREFERWWKQEEARIARDAVPAVGQSRKRSRAKARGGHVNGQVVAPPGDRKSADLPTTPKGSVSSR